MSQLNLRPRFDIGPTDEIEASELLRWAHQLIEQVSDDIPEKKDLLKRLCKIALANKATTDFKVFLQKKMMEKQDAKPDAGKNGNKDEEDLEQVRSRIVPVKERLDEFRRDFKTCTEKYTKDDVQVVLADVDIEDKVQEANHDDSEEITQVTASISRIDPISKKKIKIPVKNPNCSHIYDQNTMKVFMKKMTSGTKCPVAGCTSDKIFKFEDLQPFQFPDE